MKPGPRNNRLVEPLTSEEKEKIRLEREESLRLLNKEFEERQKKKALVDDILNQLQIPNEAGSNLVHGDELADILMDEIKVKAILTRVRNKAFW